MLYIRHVIDEEARMDEQSDAVVMLASPDAEEVATSDAEGDSIEEELRAAILRKLRPPE